MDPWAMRRSQSVRQLTISEKLYPGGNNLISAGMLSFSDLGAATSMSALCPLLIFPIQFGIPIQKREASAMLARVEVMSR